MCMYIHVSVYISVSFAYQTKLAMGCSKPGTLTPPSLPSAYFPLLAFNRVSSAPVVVAPAPFCHALCRHCPSLLPDLNLSVSPLTQMGIAIISDATCTRPGTCLPWTKTLSLVGGMGICGNVSGELAAWLGRASSVMV